MSLNTKKNILNDTLFSVIIEVSLFLFLLFTLVYLNNTNENLDNKKISSTTIKELKGILSKDIEYYHSSKWNDNSSMYLSLKEYPNILFRVPFADNFNYIVEDLHFQDSVYLKVKNIDLNMIKESQEKETVYVYEISDSEFFYFSIDDYNRYLLKNRYSENKIMQGLCILLLLIVTFILVKKILR